MHFFKVHSFLSCTKCFKGPDLPLVRSIVVFTYWRVIRLSKEKSTKWSDSIVDILLRKSERCNNIRDIIYSRLKVPRHRSGNCNNKLIFALLRVFYCYTYRLSHSKEEKVILLWWGYRFWFLLIFWVLHVYEIGPFMPNSSVFTFLMLRTLYWMICKS